jgi:hypothetical protein
VNKASVRKVPVFTVTHLMSQVYVQSLRHCHYSTCKYPYILS